MSKFIMPLLAGSICFAMAALACSGYIYTSTEQHHLTAPENR